MEMDWPARVAVWILPVLFAITVHEVAHGWVARLCGDRTAEQLGRLTLNPIKHIDPIGTLLVPALMYIGGGFLMGWAKPVPVVPQNLRNPRRDMVLVAAAGPAANLLMGLGWAGLAKLAVLYLQSQGQGAGMVPVFILCAGVAGIVINVILMVINLLPIPPLDGGRMLSGMLPPRISAKLEGLERYGLFIVMALLFSGALNWLVGPAMNWVVGALLFSAQLPYEYFDAAQNLIFSRGG